MLSSSNSNNFTNNSAYENLHSGIYVYNSDHNNLTNSAVYGHTYYGIYLYLSDYNVLDTNEVHHNTQEGIYVRNSSNSLLIGNDVYDNRYGVYVKGDSLDNDITNNILHDNQYGFVAAHTRRNTVNDNLVYYNDRSGIILSTSSSNFTVIDNVAHDNFDHGIYLYNSANNTVASNEVYNNSDDGIYVYKSSGNVLKNNHAHENTNGFVVSLSPNNTLVNNAAYERGGFKVEGSEDVYFISNNVTNTSGMAFAVISNNDVFINNLAFKCLGGGFNIQGSNNLFVNNTAAAVPGYEFGEFWGWYGHGFSTEGVRHTNNTFIGNIAHHNRLGFSISFSENNTISNNTAYSNLAGFSFDYYFRYNNITDNIAYHNFASGFAMLENTSNNILENNIAYGNYDGLYLSQAPDNLIRNNTFHNNTRGMFIEFANNTNVTDTHLYDNEKDIFVSSNYHYFVGSDYHSVWEPWDLYMVNVTLDNPSGTMENYTKISLYDSVEFNTTYSIGWSEKPLLGGLPLDRVSFANKYQLISLDGDASSIDWLVWHWDESELGGYNESAFELWSYIGDNSTGAWTKYPVTQNTVANVLAMTSHTNGIYAILQNNERPVTEISECQYISVPGRYELSNDLSGVLNGSNTCLIITSQNVSLDCNFHSITNDGTSDAIGILADGYLYSTPTNVNIMDCSDVSGYSKGVQFYTVSLSTIQNSNFHDNEYGLYLLSTCHDIILANNIVRNSGDHAIYVWDGHDISIHNNQIYENSNQNHPVTGILFSDSYNNVVWDNTFYLNDYAIVFQRSNSSVFRNNTFYENEYALLSRWSVNNNLTNNTFYDNYQGFNDAGSSDNIFSFNTVMNSSNNGIEMYNSTDNMVVNNTIINNSRNGVAIDYGDHNIFSDNLVSGNANTGFDIWASTSNEFVNNQVIENIYHGFDILAGSDDTILRNNIIYLNNHSGISMDRSDHPIIVNNTISANNWHGVELHYANDSMLDYNTFNNNGRDGIRLFVCSNSTITDTLSYSNGMFGLYMLNSNDSIIYNFDSQNNLEYGFLVLESTNIIMTNIRVNDNHRGLLLTSSDGGTLNNASIHDNDNYGLALSDSGFNASNIYIYNNDDDLSIDTHDLSKHVSIINLTIDNPSGSMENFTVLDFEDIVEVNQSYAILWTANPGSSSSFENKFIEVRSDRGWPSISQIIWHWTDSEAEGYDKESFHAAEYGDPLWSSLSNQTLNTDANSISVTNFNYSGIFGILTNVSEPAPYCYLSDYSGELACYGSRNSTLGEGESLVWSGYGVRVEEVESFLDIQRVEIQILDNNCTVVESAIINENETVEFLYVSPTEPYIRVTVIDIIDSMHARLNVENICDIGCGIELGSDLACSGHISGIIDEWETFSADNYGLRVSSIDSYESAVFIEILDDGCNVIDSQWIENGDIVEYFGTMDSNGSYLSVKVNNVSEEFVYPEWVDLDVEKVCGSPYYLCSGPQYGIICNETLSTELSINDTVFVNIWGYTLVGVEEDSGGEFALIQLRDPNCNISSFNKYYEGETLEEHVDGHTFFISVPEVLLHEVRVQIEITSVCD
ncbi:MAG: right-handed parallel beta-helix repeat-containing protein [Candidatus Thermoplasmatota archaeon]|nr:right-handed parallel beta-helix repeat-containing protein [Candidatus Thermoplasmatota archaeon]MBU1887406.1 right-handed parallel beta-helix repeat-containing protein [Candidatus Micrarchaeota archaeon]